jgi:hypothetical protein
VPIRSDLHDDHAPARHRFFGAISLCVVCGQQVKQDVGVDEPFASLHRLITVYWLPTNCARRRDSTALCVAWPSKNGFDTQAACLINDSAGIPSPLCSLHAIAMVNGRLRLSTS